MSMVIQSWLALTGTRSLLPSTQSPCARRFRRFRSTHPTQVLPRVATCWPRGSARTRKVQCSSRAELAEMNCELSIMTKMASTGIKSWATLMTIDTQFCAWTLPRTESGSFGVTLMAKFSCHPTSSTAPKRSLICARSRDEFKPNEVSTTVRW